jgi:hypothetical protein
MKVQWQRHDHRLDVELAVALEAAGRDLIRARAPAQLDRAIALNLRLWRAVRRLAECCPTLDDRDLMADWADHVAIMLVAEATPCPDPRDLSFVVGRNLSLARDLAGAAAVELARDRLIAEWSNQSGGRFEEWLLQRIDQAACP